MRLLLLLLTVSMSLTTPAQSTPAPAVRRSNEEMKGQVLTRVAPIYPPEARRAHVEGVVEIHAVIDRAGHVATLEVVSGPQMLWDAALNAVRQWTYKPYLLDGVPSAVDTTLKLSFSFGAPLKSLPNSVPGTYVAYTGEPTPVGRVRVDESVMTALLIRRVAAIYPPIAIAAQVGGTVLLHAVVSTTGEVRDVTIISGPPLLVAQAIYAVRQWRYKPYEVDGAPVEVDTTMTVPFDLQTQPAPERSQAVGERRPSFAPRVSGGVIAGQLLTKTNPLYPQEARDAHVSGSVVMRALITREGTVQDLTVMSGPAMLRDAAVDAVKQWTYKPYLLNGVPTEVDTTITVGFDMVSAPTAR